MLRAGDLNYRLDIERKECLELIQNHRWEKLQEYDQLLKVSWPFWSTGFHTCKGRCRVPGFQGSKVPRFQRCILPDTTARPRDWTPTEPLLGNSCVYVGNCISTFLMCELFGPWKRNKCSIILACCLNLVNKCSGIWWTFSEHQLDDNPG